MAWRLLPDTRFPGGSLLFNPNRRRSSRGGDIFFSEKLSQNAVESVLCSIQISRGPTGKCYAGLIILMLPGSDDIAIGRSFLWDDNGRCAAGEPLCAVCKF